MTTPRRPIQQWTLDVTVSHAPQFGHEIQAQVLTRAGGWTQLGVWRWTGLGIPEDMLDDFRVHLDAIVTEHLITRYGISSQLPLRWAGEPETS
jgi:hypothetical protein